MKYQLTKENQEELKSKIKDSKIGTNGSLWILTAKGYKKIFPGESVQLKGTHYEKVDQFPSTV